MAAPRAQADWVDIQRRWCSGESPSKIADSLPLLPDRRKLTRQAIERAAIRYKWVKGSFLPPAVKAAAPVRPEAGKPLSVDTPQLKKVSAANLARRTPELQGVILEALATGLSLAKVCHHNKMTVETLDRWRLDDPEFDAAINHTTLQLGADHIARIDAAGKRGDWKANAYLLERHPAFRDEYGTMPAGRAGGPAVNVIVNVSRADTSAPLDITPVVEVAAE